MTRLSRCTSTPVGLRALTTVESKSQIPRANSVPFKSHTPDHFPGGEIAFAARHAGRQQALAPLAQAPVSRLHPQTARLWDDEKTRSTVCALSISPASPQRSSLRRAPRKSAPATFFFLPEAMTRGMPERMTILAACKFGGHAAHGGGAVGAARLFFHRGGPDAPPR